MKFLSAFFFLFIVSCSWFRGEQSLIVIGDTEVSQKKYSDRLLEKLKGVDSVSLKDPEFLKVLKNALTRELIEETLLANWAKSKGYNPSREEIVAYIKTYLQSDQGVRDDYLLEAKPAQSTLEDTVKVQLLKQSLLKSLEGPITVTDKEAEDYYKTHIAQFDEKRIHLKQIFLEKEQDAVRVLGFLSSGKMSFEELAKKYSLSPEGKNGGDLGWVPYGQSPTIDSLFNAPSGVVSRVIQSQQGFHLFKVIKAEKNTNQPLNKVKDRVIHAIKLQKREEAYLLWLEEELKRHPVKTNEVAIQSLLPAYQENL